VDHGIYCFFGSISPQLASKTGFSDADTEKLKAILPRVFENDASSARPDGSMNVLKVVWWKHDCPNGMVSSAKVHHSLTVKSDGSIELSEVAGGPKPEIIDGF